MSDAYFMEDRREAERLANKVDSSRWVKDYVAAHLPVQARRVLDVGCGPGAIASAVASVRPRVRVIGVDISPQRVKASVVPARYSSRVSLHTGDACRLPLAPNRFDLVYCRFLLEYLRDRQTAVHEMVRVCRPGGKVLLQDLDGQLIWHDPVDESLQVRLRRVVTFLGQAGFDPLVGRKLFGIARRAGLCDIKVHIEPYHLIVGRVDAESLRLWELKLDIALPMMAKALRSEKRATQLKADLLNFFRKDETLTYSVMFTVVGTKPPLDPS